MFEENDLVEKIMKFNLAQIKVTTVLVVNELIITTIP